MAKQAPKKRRQPSRVRHYVRQWRLHRGLTQEQLAQRVGMSRGLIAQIERGWTELSERTQYALADALGIGDRPGAIMDVNPEKEGEVVNIMDALAGADPVIRAEAIGYIRGLVSSSKH